MDLYKNETVVDKIIIEKKARGGEWVKPHPECPDIPEATLYLCWSGAGKRREEGTGTTTKTHASTDHDMEDSNTKAIVDKLLTRPTGPGSNMLALADNAASNVPAPKLPKPITTPKTKTAMELHHASLTKTANAITSKLRALHAVQNDIDNMPNNTDAQNSDIDLYKAKHRFLHTSYIDTQVKVEGMLARKHSATELELEAIAATTATAFNLRTNFPCVLTWLTSGLHLLLL
jgi:hypothetical protein